MTGRFRRVRAAAAMAALALVAAACTKSSSTPAPGSSVAEGGLLRVGSDSKVDSLNPMVAFSSNSYIAFNYMYPYLVQYDQNIQFVSDFARSWQQSGDGLTWTFHTQPNAKWSDGQPLTAADAAFTLSTLVGYHNGPTALFAGIVAHMTDAVATDPNTLVVTYQSPVSNVLSQLIQIPILPQHVWAPMATGNGKQLKTFQNPAPIVAGGPFMLETYTKDQVVLFKRNPNFFGPRPHIDGFGIEMFSNDDAMITAFKTGQLDAINLLPATGVAPIRAGGGTVHSTPGVYFNDFIINSNPKKPKNRELLDPMVRQAMDDAIDRSQIITTALLGYAAPGSSVVPPSTGAWYDPAIVPTTFDIAAANQILDQLGYTKGSDGIRVTNGHAMSYSVIVPNSLSGVGDRTFQIIQSGFRQIGIQLSEKTLDDNAAFEAIGAPNWKYLQYDLAMWDWFPYFDPDYILSVLQCDQYGNNSDTAYCNSTYDQLYKKQGVTLDAKSRQAIVYRMQEMLAHDKPYLILNYPDILDAHTAKWAGFFNMPGQGLFGSVGQQSLEQVHRVG